MTKESAKYPSRINEKDEVDVILSPSGWNWTSHANEISLMFFLFVAFSCHCFYYDLKFICFLLLSTFLLLFSPLALVPNYHSKLHVYACLSLSRYLPIRRRHAFHGYFIAKHIPISKYTYVRFWIHLLAVKSVQVGEWVMKLRTKA